MREERRLQQLVEQGHMELNSCCICLQEGMRAVEGIVCQSFHYTCDTCFDMHVLTIATRDDRLARGAEVRCPYMACPSRPFSDKQVAEHTQEGALAQLAMLKKDLLEQTVIRETEERLKEEVGKRNQKKGKERKEKKGKETGGFLPTTTTTLTCTLQIAREARRLAELSEVEREAGRARQHITEKILTLKCPRCEAAFVDFDGCFALTCSHCPCRFCAWCLKDCGTNAHDCAAACGLKYGGNGYFGTKVQFEQHQNRRRRKLLKVDWLLFFSEIVA